MWFTLSNHTVTWCVFTFSYEVTKPENGCLYNVIGVATIALVLLLLVGGVTYVATKRFTERKFQNSSPETSDVSPDPCEVQPWLNLWMWYSVP